MPTLVSLAAEAESFPAFQGARPSLVWIELELAAPGRTPPPAEIPRYIQRCRREPSAVELAVLADAGASLRGCLVVFDTARRRQPGLGGGLMQIGKSKAKI